jgi:predicted adenylyl cyclase CyaB
MRNIEIKARLRDIESARKTAAAIATGRLGVQRQIDTYFHCRRGRLKLREIEGQPAQLIWYVRPDEQAPKASDYLVVPVADAPLLKSALTAAFGVGGVVDKRREIFLWHNVRIHLDEVAGLGTFIEFEAVLGPGIDDSTGSAQIDELSRRFGIGPDDLLAGSYGEMGS